MADLQTVEQAFVKAHEAGDTKAATALAAEVRRLRALQTQTPAPDQNWSDLPGNIGPSAVNLAKSFLDMAKDPISTVTNMRDVAAGGIGNALSYIPGMEYVGDTPEAKKASMVGKYLYHRATNPKETLINDPVGAAADVAGLLTGGEAALARIPGMAKAASVAGKAADIVNPLSAPKHILKAGEAVTRPVLGITTGTGQTGLTEALQAGREGGKRQEMFRGGISNTITPEDTVALAKRGIDTMRNKRSTNYETNMKTVRGSTAPVDFNPITKAVSDVIDSFYEKGHFKADPASEKMLQDVLGDVYEFQADPAMHTPIGLDALKQRIAARMPDSIDPGQRGRIVTQVTDAVRQEIIKQSPEYAKAMDDYAAESAQLEELSKSLSLNNKASVDTALRKLQSTTRNNVNTNYGARAKSVQALEDNGAQGLQAVLAGQSLNSIVPRGLIPFIAGSGVAGGLGSLGALLTPKVLAGAAAFSPRLMGEVYNAAGRAQRVLDKAPKVPAAKIGLLPLLIERAQEEQKRRAGR